MLELGGIRAVPRMIISHKNAFYEGRVKCDDEIIEIVFRSEWSYYYC